MNNEHKNLTEPAAQSPLAARALPAHVSVTGRRRAASCTANAVDYLPVDQALIDAATPLLWGGTALTVLAIIGLVWRVV